MKICKNNKGITLIALVVSIIVLLILAGISISMLTGQNGILNGATETKEKTDYAKEKEEISLAITTSKMENIGNTTKINKESFEKIFRQQYNKNITIDGNEDNSFNITFNESNRTYYVSEYGDIIDDSNVLKISTADEFKKFRDSVNNGNNYNGAYIYLNNDITLNIDERWTPVGVYITIDSEQNNPFMGIFDGKNHKIRDSVNNGNNYNGAYIYLNNDITLNIDERWTPVGVYITIDSEQNNPFMGIFDGKNHKINGININTTDKCQGLFGLVEKGTVKNVILGTENNISGGLVTAGIVAYAYDETQIINCNNMAKIESSGKTVGGIVGVANKNVKIQKNFNSGEILRKR
ncbi:MAG: type II secretion system protein [Clostridia bacterium]